MADLITDLTDDDIRTDWRMTEGPDTDDGTDDSDGSDGTGGDSDGTDGNGDVDGTDS